MNFGSLSAVSKVLLDIVCKLVTSAMIVYIYDRGQSIYTRWRKRKWFRDFAKCVKEDNNEKTLKMLSNITIPTKFDEWNNNLLHIASIANNPIIVKYLIKAGCDVNHKNILGNPPLTNAIYYNNIKTAKILLLAGSFYEDTDFRLNYGPLHLAARMGNVDMIKLLLEAGSDVNANATSFIGLTPLYEAVLKYCGKVKLENYFEVIKVLIDSGANVNNIHIYGYTYLNVIVRLGPDNLKLLQFLLDNGASVSTNECGLNILQYTLSKTRRWVFDPMYMIHPSKVPTHLKEEFRKLIPFVLKYVELFLKYGADINFRTKECHTSLGWVLANVNFEEYVDFLLNNGANIDFEDPNVLTTVNWYRYGKESAFLLMKYTALFQAQQKEDRILNFDLTKCNEEVRNYYLQCMQQLQLMKTPVIHNSISFFQIISGKTTKRYTLYENLRKVLKEKIEAREFTIYHDKLSRQFAYDKKRQELIRAAEKSLGYILTLNINEMSVVVNNILKFMTEKDLETLKLL